MLHKHSAAMSSSCDAHVSKGVLEETAVEPGQAELALSGCSEMRWERSRRGQRGDTGGEGSGRTGVQTSLARKRDCETEEQGASS